MDELSKRRPRRGRLALAVSALVSLTSLMLGATPAGADPAGFTAENFSPDTSGTGGPPQNATDDTEVTVMSDRSDGGNSTFHVTTVASTTATSVQWYFCPVAFPDEQVDAGADPATGDPTLPANGCGPAVGVDTTGALPPPPGVPAAAGEAYEAEIDVAADSPRDLVAWVCSGTTNTDADCDAEVEPNVTLDDASTDPGAASSSGEITSPPHPGNLSNSGFTASARTSPDVTGVTFCLAALDETTPTVADETGDPTECVTDANFGGMGASTTIKSDTTPNNPAAQQTSFKTWSAAYTAGETPDDLEMALLLFEGTNNDGISPANSGAGECTSMIPGDIDCQLDSHYVVSTPSAATSAVIAFPDEGNTATLPNDCTEADRTSAAESAPEQYMRVQGCVLDQAGNNITGSVHWAFQISPLDAAGTPTDETGFECFNPGAPPKPACSDTTFPDDAMDSGEHQVDIGVPPASFGWPDYECNGRDPNPGPPFGLEACPTGNPGADGVQNDLNADRFYEQADGDPAATGQGIAGIADQVLEFHTGATYTVSFCFDSNNDAATSATPCTGEGISVTGTHKVRAATDHVHVKRSGETDALCHTGAGFAGVPEGSSVTLLGCAVALLGTAEQPAAEAHVAWVLNPGGAPGTPGTIQNAEETTDAQGQATAEVTSDTTAGGKSTVVRFCLDEFPESTTGGENGNGTCDAAEPDSGAEGKTQADFRIDWSDTGGGGDRNLCSASRTNSGQDEILVGTNGSETICGFSGDDTIRGLGGADTLKGGSGNDTLVGGKGGDSLRGGSGKDTLRGGKGDDSLKGQGGKDTARGGADDDFCKAETEKACEKG